MTGRCSRETEMRNFAAVTLVLLSFLVIAGPVRCATYIVKPDGTGDFPELQAAVDGSSNGDEILLTDGVFQGRGFNEVYLWGKALTIRSQSGNPETCIIDPEGSLGVPRAAFLFENGEGPDSVIKDMTIVNGSTATSC